MQSCLCFSKLGPSFLRRHLLIPRLQAIRHLQFRNLSHRTREKHKNNTKAITAETKLFGSKYSSNRTRSVKHYGRHMPWSAITPNQALENYLDIEDHIERSSYWKKIRHCLKRDTLPFLLMHHMHTVHLKDWDIFDTFIHSNMDEVLRKHDFSNTDVVAWADVLSQTGSDDRIDKFFNTLSYYPSFLLLEVCRRDIHRVSSLNAILLHVWKRVVHKTDGSSNLSSSDGLSSSLTSPMSRNVIEVNAFYALLARLLYHCRRLWPAAMVTVAHIMSSYIDTLLTENMHESKIAKPHVYRKMCSLQNELLQHLALPAAFEPYLSMDHNWAAQKIILGLSSKFDPPLTLDQHAYRAVIQVLTASKKSQSETRSATLRSRTWPPWRIEQDGMDAQRELDEDLSRSIAALMRKRESGYADLPTDQVMSILGGQESDGTPTIQTRAIVNTRRQLSGEPSDTLHPDVWAARIRATRNVQEAWGAFTTFSKHGGVPNVSIFLAMFRKLAYERKRSAMGVEPSGAPGDGLEVYAVPDDNISEFYKSSLQPPSLEELYSKMLESGTRPKGYCLSFLVRRAHNISDGVHYLVDSGLTEHALQYLHGGDPETLPFMGVGSEIKASWSEIVPAQATTDFIILLCRFAPRAIKIPRSKLGNQQARDESGSENVWIVREVAKQHSHPIYRRPLQHAAHLLKISKTKERIAWYSLWKALSKPNIVLIPSLCGDPKNFELAWYLAARSLTEFLKLGLELDSQGFLYLCDIFIKYAKVSTTIVGRHQPTKVREATDTIKAEFRKLTRYNEQPSHYHLPRFMHSVHGVHLHAYVRSMAAVEDYAGILSALEWMVLNATDLDYISNRIANGIRLIRRTLVAIRFFCEGSAVENKARVLVESVESWNGWPTDNEVTTYQMLYEPNHVDESLVNYTNDESLKDNKKDKKDDADQLDLNLKSETEKFSQHTTVISRYYSRSEKQEMPQFV